MNTTSIDLHAWLNSIVLILLGIGYFTQGTVLKYLKTALEAINPQKLKEASEHIAKGEEMKYKALMSVWVEEQKDNIAKTGLSIDKKFSEQFDEMFNSTAIMLSRMNPASRESAYAWFPKTADSLRERVRQIDLAMKDQPPQP